MTACFNKLTTLTKFVEVTDHDHTVQHRHAKQGE